MESIQWKHFSPDTFRNFCNALLWLEIGDEFKGYEAPGKDGGIDGFFGGRYQHKDGPWRFQYKFHSTERKKAFQTLKTELTTELKKLRDEKQFVLLTNTALLPQEASALERTAQDYFESNGLTGVQFGIWDSAVLSRLYLKHPLLKLWMEEGYTARSLVPYKTKFENRLRLSGSSIDTLTNFFVSREEEISQLSRFLEDRDRHLAIIKGEAGIGKTRLVVEFFKKHIDPGTEWIALCVTQFHLDFDKLRFSLANRKNYILWVDDAQNFTSQQLADLYRLAGQHGGSLVKLIFTIRGLASYEAFRLINSFDQDKALLLALDKLSKEDTKKIFEAHLSSDYLRNFLDQLVLLSRGRPILIIGMLSAAERGENITKIKSQTAFKDYVLEYFDTFLKTVTQHTGVDNLKVKQFLGLVCLLEPFCYDAPRDIEKLSSLEKVSEEFVVYFLKQLREHGISTGSYQHSIKPDYYSDIFLQSILDSFWLEKKLSQYTDFTSNILTNLASLDEVEENKSTGNGLLDKYMGDYIGQMKDTPSSESFKERLRVANSIAFQKPQLAQKAVQLFLATIRSHEHPFYKDYIANRAPEHLQHDSSFSLVRGILSDLLYYPQYYDFIFDTVIELFQFTKNKNWFDVFAYQHPIYLYQSSIQVQKFFVKKAGVLLPEAEEETILFLVEGLHQLLSLSFNATRWGVLNENTIQISTHFLPKVPVVEQYRLSILSLLKTYYLHYKGEVIRLEALKNILDVPREISHAKRNKSSYRSDAEIKFILDFLETYAKDASVGGQKEILDELYWYKLQRVDKKFHPRLQKIEKLLTPQSPTQKFVQVFCYLETQLEDRGNKAKERINDLLANHTNVEIAKVFSDLYHAKGGWSYYYTQTIQDFTALHTAKAKETYLQLKEMDKDFLYDFASHFLRAFRSQEPHEEFFWRETEYWLAEGNPKAINVLLHTYSIYFVDLRYARRDSALLETLCTHHDHQTEYNLAHALPTLYKMRGKESERWIVLFLYKCQQRNAEHFFRLLLDANADGVFGINLFLKHSLHFALTHFLENSLLAVSKHLSAEEIFQYFLARFEYTVRLVGDEHYRHQFVPTGDHNFFAEKLEKDKRSILFKKALTWFVGLQVDNWRTKALGENLVDYLKPSHDIDESLTAIYRRAFNQCNDDGQAVLNLVHSLTLFHNKSPELISLIHDFASDILTRYPADAALLASFTSYSRSAITAAGVKSGTPGQPFAFDLNLKKLLIETLPAYEGNQVMNEILRGALKYTEATIARDSEREITDVW